MKTSISILAFCLSLSSLLHSQNVRKPNPTNPWILDFTLKFQEQRILDIAEVMPDEKYSFAPTSGEFSGVRTFGEQLKHIAADNYLLGAAILGEKAPGDTGPGESGSARVHGKAEIIAYVKDSFAYMRRAAATIDASNEPIPTPAISPWPKGTATRLGIAIEDCVHTWDHYGQLAEYLRMNGIVPPQSQPKRDSISEKLDFWIGTAEREIVPAADAMPEERYSFAPTAGEFTGARTFAQQIKHLAANNYRMAAYIFDQTPTPDQEAELGPDDVRSKAQIADYLRGSFAALHRAAAAITAQNMLEPMASHPVPRQNTRVQFVIDAVAHSYDHYGQMVEYLRMNRIVPPASRR